MNSSIRLLAPTEPLREQDILVILRTMAGVDYELAVKDNQYVCDLFLFASHLFEVDFTRICLSLDMVVLDGYESLPQLKPLLEETGGVLHVLIRDIPIDAVYSIPHDTIVETECLHGEPAAQINE